MNYSNQSADAQSFTKSILITCLSAQISVSSVGAIVNVLLMYSQIKSTWAFYRRILFINVTTAALISTLIHAVQGSYQFKKLMTTGRGDLVAWSDFVGDIAQTAVSCGMVFVALVNLFLLYRCSRECASGQKKPVAHKRIVAFGMVLCVWIAAVGLVSGGLNPQAQVYDKDQMRNSRSYASLVVGILIELSVSSAVLTTIRLLGRSKIDFEIRQAQQKLDLRVRIKRTIVLTAIIYRILILHSFIWVTAVVVGFGLNRFMESTDQHENDPNRVAAYTSLVDLIQLCFDSTFPFVVMRKESGLRLGFLRFFCVGKPEKIYPTRETKSNANAPENGEVQLHFSNLSGHWQRVAAIKYTSNHPGRSARSTIPKSR